MKTWIFVFDGSVDRRHGGSSVKGRIEVRATSIDEALLKFYSAFNKAAVRITSIGEGD